MGFQKGGRGTVQRIKRAHLDRNEQGEIIARYFDFVYYFTGEQANTLTLKGEEIARHPKFKGIDAFEGWCMRYYAEHDTEKGFLRPTNLFGG